jgi:uncharacterized protein (DUF486 family)
MKSLVTIGLLTISNIFMTLAWYSHLYLNKSSILLKWGLFGLILLSWGLAFFEYVFQVPANRLGHEAQGGPFTLFQLRIIQEVISLTVFTLIAVFVFKSDRLQWNHLAAFLCLVLAVYFIFRK